MNIKFFRKCSVTLLLFPLILAFSSLTGCIEGGSQPLPESTAGGMNQQPGEWSGQLRVEIDPELEKDLFCLRGNVFLTGTANLSSLLLNATLSQGRSLVVSTKYLLMELEPNREYSFEIAKNSRLMPGEYICTLEASGPCGSLARESIRCSLEEDQANSSPPSFSSQGFISLSDAKAFFVGQALEKGSNEVSSGRVSSFREEEEDDERTRGEHEDERVHEDERDESLTEPSLEGERTDLESKGEASDEGSGEDGSELEFSDEAGNEEMASGLRDMASHGGDLVEDTSSLAGHRAFIKGSNAAESVAEPAVDDLYGEEIVPAIVHQGVVEQRLVGSSTSKKYHLPDCRYAEKIKPENRIYFQSEKEAKSQGYLPCKSCHP